MKKLLYLLVLLGSLSVSGTLLQADDNSGQMEEEVEAGGDEEEVE